jgi:hypothetical protein
VIAIRSLLAAARRRPRAARAALASSALALLCAASASAATMPAAQTGQSLAAPAPPLVSATLVQCVTTDVQGERSATFSGEMTAIPGTVRMVMRLDLEERMGAEPPFRSVSAPGLGVWRDSERKVKVYKSLQQVTNLSAPAAYRALVSFRWLNAKGRVIRHTERFTPKCVQRASPPFGTVSGEEPSSSSSSSSSSSQAPL